MRSFESDDDDGEGRTRQDKTREGLKVERRGWGRIKKGKVMNGSFSLPLSMHGKIPALLTLKKRTTVVASGCPIISN
jgi:hypothetical protein